MTPSLLASTSGVSDLTLAADAATSTASDQRGNAPRQPHSAVVAAFNLISLGEAGECKDTGGTTSVGGEGDGGAMTKDESGGYERLAPPELCVGRALACRRLLREALRNETISDSSDYGDTNSRSNSETAPVHAQGARAAATAARKGGKGGGRGIRANVDGSLGAPLRREILTSLGRYDIYIYVYIYIYIYSFVRRTHVGRRGFLRLWLP